MKNRILMKLFFSITMTIFIFSCKSHGNVLGAVEEKERNYDKFEDDFHDGEYYNKDLNLRVLFDSEWQIKTMFKYFDRHEKKYADYFVSRKNEVLFLGYNETRKIGVRCTVEQLGIEPQEHFEDFQKEREAVAAAYNIKYEIKEEVVLKNIQAYQVIYDILINDNNQFKFHTLYFSNNAYNFRLDIWVRKEAFDSQKDYIFRLLQTVDFFLPRTPDN